MLLNSRNIAGGLQNPSPFQHTSDSEYQSFHYSPIDSLNSSPLMSFREITIFDFHLIYNGEFKNTFSP